MWQRFENFPRNQDTVTPSDTVDFPQPSIVVANSTGNISAVSINGDVEVWAVVSGFTIPCVCRRVNSTSTTAASIKRVW
jgi:hypothetical protein